MINKVLLILLTFNCSLITVEAQWVLDTNGMGNQTVISLATSGNTIFAGTGNGVFLSTNNGTNWTQTSLNNRSVWSLAVNGNNIFAGTGANYGVYLSTDNGTNWTQTSLNNRNVRSLAVNGNNVFAGTSYGVYLSADNGTTWTQTSLNNRNVFSLAVSGNNIFAGTDDYPNNGFGVYKSTDNGTSWIQTSLNNRNVRSLAVNGNNIFAAAIFNGVYISTNNGTSWTQTSYNSEYDVLSFALNGINIFAGCYNGGVYVSNNNGTSWTERNEGLGNQSVRALCISNNYIFAGPDARVYRRPLGELVSIQPISNEVPAQFQLYQNYPNPFNPRTNVKFQIPNSGFTKLVIYDIMGREVATLVNEQLNAGTFEVNWDASKFTSGVYYYKLVVGDNTNNGDGFTETKKMILVK